MIINNRKSSNNKEVFMPAYEYDCKDCGKEFTVFLSIREFEAKPKIKCPHCESDNVQKKLTGFFTKTSKKS
jgi:putative FmdB family regulatory protein